MYFSGNHRLYGYMAELSVLLVGIRFGDELSLGSGVRIVDILSK